MNIPSNIIKDYLYEKFEDFSTNNEEFLVDSIFAEDKKKHMSINMGTGLWQDFKSKETGNFPQLISHIEGISEQEAHKYLGRKLFDSPEALFDVSTVRQKSLYTGESKVEEEFKNFKKLNIRTALLSDSLSDRLAAKTVISRRLQGFTFYVGEEGKYANRLIIPYKHKGSMIYFQARKLSSYGIKYLNPGKDSHRVQSSEMLFPFNESLDYVIVTEGPMDAIALQLNGLNATCIQGSMMSYTQARELRGRKVILSFDNDEPGREGAVKARNILLRLNTPNIQQVQPPEGYKDWNAFHIDAQGTDKLYKYVTENIEKMNFSFFVSQALSTD
tara:strand:- start:1529 stop:2518 length:990 start_codon:yes stop_codon:yes gene_type:complete